jgi:citronellol/citronellal dehydrogenase
MKNDLNGKKIFITGATRGIGLAIAKRVACDGASVVVAAKSVENNPKIPGTIYSAVEEIKDCGGNGLAVQCDIRFEDQIENAVNTAVDALGGIDILINNASAIDLRNIDALDMKRFDLMHQVNGRGSYLCAKACLPYLRKSDNPHILTLSPPLDMSPKWFSPMLAYSMAKYGMSLVTLGLAEQLKKDKIAVNSLWPETVIATAAVGNLLGGDALIQQSRKAEIVADAAYEILTRDSATCTGNFFIDVNVLVEAGITDFTGYAINPSNELALDFFLSRPITDNVTRKFM